MSNNDSYILLVDDVPDNIKVLGNMLREENYNIEIATSGLQALHMVKERLPDLILLDIMMPDMSGWEVCIDLKESRETRDIPVIFLTARIEEEDIIQGFKLGAVDYVTKPFNSSEHLARVNTHLELVRSKKLLMEKNRENKELLHVLCHDLANPFISMVYMSNMLNKLDDIEKLREIVSNIGDTAKNGLELIALVRKMRALEDGKLKLEACNLNDAVGASVFIARSRLSEKEIKLNVDINNELLVFAEKTSLLNSVISNILLNSIKFSYPGSVIDIKAENIDNRILLSIEDYGIGMSAELLDNIFDTSHPTTRSGTQGELGTGFGMPLVKKFIDVYGSDIEIQSFDENSNPDNHGTKVMIFFQIAKI